SPNGRHHQIGKLQAGDVVLLGAQIKPHNAIVDVVRSNVSRASNLEIQPSQLEFPVKRRVAFLGDNHSAPADVASNETKTLNQYVETKHVGIEGGDSILSEMLILADRASYDGVFKSPHQII